MTISFDGVNKLIKILAGTGSPLPALTIYSQAMDWADDQGAMCHTPPMYAVGKAPLGGGVYTDSIFVLQDGWKIKLYDGTYQFIIMGTVITDDETPRTVPPDSGNVEAVFQVSSQGTLIPDVAEWTQAEKDEVKAKVASIPPDLPGVPTHSELIAAHGSSSWEGATPTQLWAHPSRELTSRNTGGEEIAAEQSLDDIKGTTFQTAVDSLKKIREMIEALSVPKAVPKSIAEYEESILREGET